MPEFKDRVHWAGQINGVRQWVITCHLNGKHFNTYWNCVNTFKDVNYPSFLKVYPLKTTHLIISPSKPKNMLIMQWYLMYLFCDYVLIFLVFFFFFFGIYMAQCVNGYWIWCFKADGAGSCGDNTRFMKDQVCDHYVLLFKK